MAARGEVAAGSPGEPGGMTGDDNGAGTVVINDTALTARLEVALKAGLGEKNVGEMPAKMTSEDFAEYWNTGKVPSALLHIGAVTRRPKGGTESRVAGGPALGIARPLRPGLTRGQPDQPVQHLTLSELFSRR